MKKDKKPFIHLFRNREDTYLYDVNTDEILEIPENVFENLKQVEYLEEINDENVKSYLEDLVSKGFLKESRIEISEHQETPYIKELLNNKLSSIVLQVTQNCNLRCDYCIYSGSYNNRVHNNKRMSFELAKKAIDFLIDHSKDSKDLHIGFYGGEPLLEYELIKKCINYSKTRGRGKKFYFNLTTNGTLLNEEMIEFFEENNLTLMFSLDGPKEVHDESRKTIDYKGSFEILYKNLEMIYKNYNEFYKKHVIFNTVLNPTRGYYDITNYFKNDELFKKSIFLKSLINTSNLVDKEKYYLDEKFIEESRYEHFLVLLNKVNLIDENDISPLAKIEGGVIDNFRNHKRTILPKKGHHGGPCVPGYFRIFVNVDGKFYPCEKVSEISDYATIGNIESGFDFDKVDEMLNIERYTSKECHNCWAYRYCDICIGKVDASDKTYKKSILERCDFVRNETEAKLKDYCILKKYRKTVAF